MIYGDVVQRAHCFASRYLMPIVHQNNGLQPKLLALSLANKKTQTDISEPAIFHEYWSENFLVQQPSFYHLYGDFRYNNNVMAESNDCIGGLLHLGLNFILFRTLLHLGPNVIKFRTKCHYIQDRYYI